MKYEEIKDQLKEGTKVRVLSNKCCPDTVGKILPIEYISGTPGLNKGSSWCSLDDDLMEIEIANPVSERSESSGNLKVGDRVRVIDQGKQYTTYEAWAEKVNAQHWIPGSLCHKGDTGVITRLEEHSLGTPWILALVKINSKEHIICVDGLEKIEGSPKIFATLPDVGSIWRASAIEDLADSVVYERAVHIDNQLVKSINAFSEPKATETQRKGFMNQAISFVKSKALKATNPDEYELRKAGLHNDCGDLTDEGEALHMEFLRELTKEKMVETAKEMNAEQKDK